MNIETELLGIPHPLRHLTETPMQIAVYRRKLRFADLSDIDEWWNYYAQLIGMVPQWTLLGYYTQKKSMDQLDPRCLGNLERLKWDCREGKVDLVFTQSLYQLARSVVGNVAFVRELKSMENPVGVFFERIHLYTLDKNADMLLTIFAVLAKDERREIGRSRHGI